MEKENYRPAYGSPISLKIGKSIHVAVLKTDGLVIMDAANGKTLAFEKWETSYRTNASTPSFKVIKYLYPLDIVEDALSSNGMEKPFKKFMRIRTYQLI